MSHTRERLLFHAIFHLSLFLPIITRQAFRPSPFGSACCGEMIDIHTWKLNFLFLGQKRRLPSQYREPNVCPSLYSRVFVFRSNQTCDMHPILSNTCIKRDAIRDTQSCDISCRMLGFAYTTNQPLFNVAHHISKCTGLWPAS